MGPAAAGKTGLSEALLARAGAIGAAGTLERDSTVSDFDPLERKMQHSLNAAVMHFTSAGTRVVVLWFCSPSARIAIGLALPSMAGRHAWAFDDTVQEYWNVCTALNLPTKLRTT